MTVEVSERSFEDTIEMALLQNGPETRAPFPERFEDPRAPAEPSPGGYVKRRPEDYDRALCLVRRDVLDFILATQPKEWERLSQHHGAEVKERFVARLSREVGRRGVLDVLRKGVKDSGCNFQLAFFRPASGLNATTQRLYAANLFSVVRQLRYSEKNESSLDLVIFLNGLPVFTAELKNPLSGQNVEDAIKQYQSRDAREPLLGYGRCLGHFAVDPELVFVSSELKGQLTRFLPFNQGRFGGAGNPPVPPTESRYATSYLWDEIWAKDSVLDLVRQFIHDVEEEDDKGKKTGRRFLIFPRHHQIEVVRKLVREARWRGAGHSYLIQHSAGSGKTYTIAWLAHRLSTLHDAGDKRVFDSIVVVTDRKVLDSALQRTLRQFEQTLGVVENIDKTSRQLREALESGKTIIVTTLQKFPVVAKEIGELPGKRFAVIVDEAHSSQSGETTKSLKSVLRAQTLEAAEKQEEKAPSVEEEVENAVLEALQSRGRRENLSTFAFTATPKQKTLELFGRPRLSDGKPVAFHLYSMRQAIEEKFILDVLQNYTTYQAYWRLLKTIENDPHYDKSKASYLLKSFVELSPHAIEHKVRIMVDHFAAQVQGEIGGKAKAMLVTRSRLHAVRYKLAFDRYLAEKGHQWKSLVAFSGTVKDGTDSFTESGMNTQAAGKSLGRTENEFEKPEYRFLIVANKFQTGFNQPLLHTMYVDKKLGDVNAVQTLSRLNRIHPEKKGTAVLDFANEAKDIQKAFEDYYETTLLSETTDPHLLYDIQAQLLGFHVYTETEVEGYARIYFNVRATRDQSRLYAYLAPLQQRFQELTQEQQHDFRAKLGDYARLYAFLAQIITFSDPALEKLHVFARHLRRVLPSLREELPREIQQHIDLDSHRVQETSSGRIPLERRVGELEPMQAKGTVAPEGNAVEPLSQIIGELNDRFGLKLGAEHRSTLEQLRSALDGDASLDASARANTRENVRLSFDPKVEDKIQEIVETNFELYRRITDDPAFGNALKNLLFDDYIRRHRRVEDLLALPESKTLEFKSSLRWDLVKGEKNDKHITHAVLKTIAAFLNTEGGDLLIGVADDGSVLGIEHDQLDTDDKFMRHLVQVVQNGLGDRAGTCIVPTTQVVEEKTVCLVSCQRSPEPVFLKWKGLEASATGDLFVRSGPRTDRLSPESAAEYVRTRFGT